MNGAHLHLLVNHLPIMGSFIAIPLVALALWRNRDAGLLGAAVLVLVLGALGAVGAGATGDGAEEVVEDMPAVSESAIKVHEERADIAEGVSLVTAALGLGMLFWRLKKSESLPRLALGGLLGASLLSGAGMAAVGAAGGVIHHPEIRGDALNKGLGGDGNGPRAGGPSEGAEQGEAGDDEDEEGEK